VTGCILTRQRLPATGRLDSRAQPTPSPPWRERGAITVPAALAIGAAALIAIPLLFGSALLGTDDASSCGMTVAAQPGVAAAATSSIPVTYLRLYQAAGAQYGVPWNLLAAIGKIESDHGRSHLPGIRSGANAAGAAGPMQFGIGGRAGNTWGGAPRHPARQKTGGYAVDGNADGWVDVYDPADAIPAAARYLIAHGAPAKLPQAVFAYNRSSSYVQGVLTQAARYATGDFQLLADTGAAIAGCPGDAAAFAAIPGTVVAKALTFARAQLGKPYVFGAQGPDAFDCSGLTMRAFQAAGITIPRVASDQYHHGPRIPPGQEQPGDLVFFVGSDGTRTNPGHVGIVIGDGRMIEARCTKCGPITTSSYTTRHPLGFTRPAAHPSS
jgi:peptidoglycan DL-endopeptidase CwlO